jgi:hypothetical protein
MRKGAVCPLLLLLLLQACGLLSVPSVPSVSLQHTVGSKGCNSTRSVPDHTAPRIELHSTLPTAVLPQPGQRGLIQLLWCQQQQQQRWYQKQQEYPNHHHQQHRQLEWQQRLQVQAWCAAWR